MNVDTKLCDVCKRRPAVYRRRDSGEKLCTHCLSRSLVKRIKRGISRSVKLRHGALVAVLALRERIVESLALTEIVSLIEEKHGGHVLILALDHTVSQVIHARLARKISLIYLAIKAEEEIKSFSLPEIINSLTPRLQSMGFRIDAILTPLTLNDFFEIQLQSLLANTTLAREVSPLPRIIGQSVIVHPMGNILRQDVYAYAFFKGILDDLNDASSSIHIVEDKCITPVLKSISADFSEHHPELMFKFVETMASLTLMITNRESMWSLRVAQPNH